MSYSTLNTRTEPLKSQTSDVSRPLEEGELGEWVLLDGVSVPTPCVLIAAAFSCFRLILVVFGIDTCNLRKHRTPQSLPRTNRLGDFWTQPGAKYLVSVCAVFRNNRGCDVVIARHGPEYCALIRHLRAPESTRVRGAGACALRADNKKTLGQLGT